MTKEVMKQALDSLEKERYYYCLYEDEDGAPEHILDAIQALKEALKQEQGEQGEQLARLGWQEIDCPICGGGARVFPKQEQGEPVGEVSDHDWSTGLLYRDLEPGTPLYTTPQTKEWVGLTDEEIDALFASDVDFRDVHAFSRAIEAKLKERNT